MVEEAASEEVEAQVPDLPSDAQGSGNGTPNSGAPERLPDVEMDGKARLHTGVDELDRVMGGGIMQGSFSLIAGDPGIGKSTLMTELAGYLPERVILYVTGEESKRQVKLRAQRLGVDADTLYDRVAECLGLTRDELVDDRPIDAAEIDQLNEPEAPDALVEEEPMHWPETAQSITIDYKQAQTTIQDNKHQQQAAAGNVLRHLEALGFSRAAGLGLIGQYGDERVQAVVRRAEDASIRNPAGFVRRALERNWAVPVLPAAASSSGSRYVTGQYADFLWRG